jgi:hypothetical protein
MPKMKREPYPLSSIDWSEAQKLGSPVEDIYAIWLKIGGMAIHTNSEALQTEAALHVLDDVLDEVYEVYEALGPLEARDGYMSDEEIAEVFGE